MEKIKVGIIGVGGFARIHLQAIANCQDLCVLGAAVIREQDRARALETEKKMVKKGIAIYRDYRQMLDRERGRIQLISIPVGIHQHAELSISALRHGYHVVCEKPAAGTIAEARQMRAVQRETGKILAIGYQDIFSPSIQRIKAIRLAGELGRLKSASCFVLWPRSSAYYDRNSWAGKFVYKGKKIQDSPIQNAVSHFLNAMLYVAGDAAGESALPHKVLGENYRAKGIESADTQAIRVLTRNGVTIYFVASHAVEQLQGPIAEYLFEKGRVQWEFSGQTHVYRFTGASEVLRETFDNQGKNIHNLVFRNTLEAIINGGQPLSTIHNAFAHTVCVENSFLSSKGSVKIPTSWTRRIKPDKEEYGDLKVDERTYSIVVNGLEDTILKMYRNSAMFFEAEVPWAVESETIRYSEDEPAGL